MQKLSVAFELDDLADFAEFVFFTTGIPALPYSDSNLLTRHLKPVGKQIGVPWLSCHTLRRTHATLLSQSGASPKDAQAQLGHAHIHHDGYLHPTHADSSARGRWKDGSIGDELTIWEKMTDPQTT